MSGVPWREKVPGLESLKKEGDCLLALGFCLLPTNLNKGILKEKGPLRINIPLGLGSNGL